MYHPEIQTNAKVTLPEVRYLGLDGTALKGSVILVARRPQVLHASPVSPALTQTLALWRFEELLLLLDFDTERHTSYQPVCRLSSRSPPSCSPVFTVPFFVLFFFLKGCISSEKWTPFFLFFFIIIFKDIKMNAHQLTGTKLDLFINSLWFNSLTLTMLR